MAPGVRTSFRRGSAIPLAVMAVAGLIAFTPTPAAAAPPSSAEAAAAWLATRMVEGNRLQNDFGSDDAGVTVDAMLAFAAAGVEKDRVAAAMTWLTDPDVLNNYILAFTSGYHAGETAKVVFGMQVAGGDPTKVNGLDLVAVLTGLEVTSGPSAGLFQNADPTVGDDTNAFDQALAVLALARTPGGAPAAAVDFLAGTACASGGFPITLADPPATCTGDPDGTAMVVQALLAAGDQAAATDAVAWLLTQVDPTTGGVKPGFQGGAPNANSAGLVAEALRAFGDDAAADKVIGFLHGLQVGCAGAAENQGAIAYTATDPADPDNTGFLPFNAPRATAQAILGLAGVPLGQLGIGGARTGGARLDCPVATATPTTTIPGAAGILPVTGSSLVPIVFAGAGLVVAGAALLWRYRRRRDVTGDWAP
jgi:LPXTG-motif cell wall-anchored protein